MHLSNKTRTTVVGNQITIADTSVTRLIGLVGRRRFDAGCGLLIRPSSGIHTFGMLFAIDVIALSKDLQVLRLWHRLAPFRMTAVSLKFHCMLELPSGQIRDSRTETGDWLEFA